MQRRDPVSGGQEDYAELESKMAAFGNLLLALVPLVFLVERSQAGDYEAEAVYFSLAAAMADYPGEYRRTLDDSQPGWLDEKAGIMITAYKPNVRAEPTYPDV